MQTLVNWNPWWESGSVSPDLKGFRRPYTDELISLPKNGKSKSLPV